MKANGIQVKEQDSEISKSMLKLNLKKLQMAYLKFPKFHTISIQNYKTVNQFKTSITILTLPNQLKHKNNQFSCHNNNPYRF